MIKRVQAGTTREFTWQWPGSSPTSVAVGIFSGSETVVSSQTMIDSGNGYYYANVTVPSSYGYYSAKFTASVGGNPYIDTIRFKTVYGEVD